MHKPEEASEEGAKVKAAGFSALLRDRILLRFLVAAFLFHLANAAMLPQLGEMLSKDSPESRGALHVGVRHRDAVGHNLDCSVDWKAGGHDREEAASTAGIRCPAYSRSALYVDPRRWFADRNSDTRRHRKLDIRYRFDFSYQR